MNLKRWLINIGATALAVGGLAEFVVILNLATINESQFAMLHGQSSRPAIAPTESLMRLRREALTRAALYNSLIEKNMLVDGMVITRNEDNKVEGLCDSLLFSSLRLYAISKLGFSDSAKTAWTGILGSRRGAQWLRHPKCTQSLSRDMIMGVLIALQANPEHGDEVFRAMLADIDRHWGFVGDGPIYVSWLSPGIAGLLRMEAERRHVPFDEWPWILKQSFSSIEFDSVFMEAGYVSHLAALGLWIEMAESSVATNFNPRSLWGQVDRMVDGEDHLDTKMDGERRKWIASHLRSLNGSNLFFAWLDQRAFDVMSSQSEEILLGELLSMPQFPVDRLPMDCDRDADYIWQRRELDELPVARTCRKTFSGVDFLWIAALLNAGPLQ